AAAAATLDFGLVAADLTFTIDSPPAAGAGATSANTVVVSDAFGHTIKAYNVANVIGGTRANTFRFTGDGALPGTLTTPAGGTTVLDYSRSNAAAFVNLTNAPQVVNANPALVSVTAARAATGETFRLGNNASGGFFRLMFA